MIWNQEKNEVEIVWKENKGKNNSPVTHAMSKTPVKLQLHPKTGHIIRAHFMGGRPSWIPRYTLAEHYRSTELVGEDGPGWWIANWNTHVDRPLSSPKVKGMLTEWLSKVSDVFEAEKQQLFEGIETVESNLLFHYESFESYGLYFRPELIKRDGGSLYLSSSAIPIDKEGEKADRSLHQNFLELVGKLLEPNEIPEVEELLLEEEEVDVSTFTLDLKEEELVLEEEELDFEEDPEHFFMMEEAARDEEEFGLIQLEEEEFDLSEEPIQQEEITEPVNEVVTSKPEIAEEVEQANETIEVEETKVSETKLVSEETKTKPPLVAEKINKRENIIAGQTLLF